jgi:hypothetical protein
MLNEIPSHRLKPYDVIQKRLILEEARFFFPADICEFLERLVADCQHVIELHAERQTVGDESPKWIPIGDRIVDELARLDEVRRSLPKVFETVLSFSQLTKPSLVAGANLNARFRSRRP